MCTHFTCEEKTTTFEGGGRRKLYLFNYHKNQAQIPGAMSRIFCILALSLFSASAAFAQTAEDLFQQGLRMERLEADSDGAIDIYKLIVNQPAASRFSIARALVQLGKSYELNNYDEAVTVYSRLVSEFPDQPNAFLAAHEGLGRMRAGLSAGTIPGTDEDYTLMMGDAPFGVNYGPWGREYDISPDGKTIIFSAPPLAHRAEMYPELENELYFVQSGSIVRRPVLEDTGGWIGGDFGRWLPRWSPNGKQILFKARRRGADQEVIFARHDLGSNETVLLPDVRSRHAMTWLPDNRRFMTITREGFNLYSMDGKLLRKYETDMTNKRLGSVSPDGQYLAYMKASEVATTLFMNLDIWLLDLTTGEHIKVTSDAGMKGPPTWSRDSRFVYYTRGNTSVFDSIHLYKASVGTGATPEQITSYTNATVYDPLILAGTGELTYALSSRSSTILTAPANSPEQAREIIPGSTPVFSPDGKKIYFNADGIWSASATGADPRQLVPGGNYGYNVPSLSPNGKHIAYSKLEEDQTVVYTKSTEGGAPKRLYAGRRVQNIVPVWSPDGKELAFGDGSDLMVIAADGSTTEVIAGNATGWESSGILWSPDGSYLAGLAYMDEGTVLFVVNRQTAEVRRLTSSEEQGYKEALSWHPDGERLSYRSQLADGSRMETRVASIFGETSEVLPHKVGEFDTFGRWGPDGRYYYINYGSGRGQILVYDEETQLVELFLKPEEDRELYSLPSWNKDGSIITWSEGAVSTQLWMVTNFE